MVRVTGEGPFTVVALTAPHTPTILLAVSSLSSTAVMVTVPVLVVVLAGMVRVAFALRE